VGLSRTVDDAGGIPEEDEEDEVAVGLIPVAVRCVGPTAASARWATNPSNLAF
jgi:hypothetical protein